MNRKELLIAALLTGTALLPAACDYDDTLYNTPHPTQGVVVVHTDYDRGAYFLRAGSYLTALEGSDDTCPEYFDPGTYTLSLYNLPEGMTDNGGTLTIDRLDDGTLTPQPGTLYAAATEQATVVADDTLHIHLPMPQRTRQLTLRLTVTTGDASLLAGVEARLTGLAQALDAATLGLAGEAADAKPVFTLKDGVLTAPLNLLGTMPQARQYLTVTLTNRDSQSQTLGFDLSELLASFNTGTSPLTLDADLQLMEGADFGFSISDWTDGGSDSGDAV